MKETIILHSYHKVGRLVLHYPNPYQVLNICFHFSHPHGYEEVPYFESLADGFEHFFMCSLAMRISFGERSLEKGLLRCTVHFQIIGCLNY